MRKNPDLSNISTDDLAAEIKRREENPTWFIKDLVADGHDLDTDEFREATAWMDEADYWAERHRESED